MGYEYAGGGVTGETRRFCMSQEIRTVEKNTATVEGLHGDSWTSSLIKPFSETFSDRVTLKEVKKELYLEEGAFRQMDSKEKAL